MVLPFQVCKRNMGDLFLNDIKEVLTQDNLPEQTKCLSDKLQSYCDQQGNYSSPPGDFSKYYDFMRSYFGKYGQGIEFEVFKLNTSQIDAKPGFECKNLQAQFEEGAWLGESEIKMKKPFGEVTVVVNPSAGIGFFVFGFTCYTLPEENIADQLAACEFFRNVGWRRNQNLGPSQLKKHQWRFTPEGTTGLTMHETLNRYFSDLSDCIRFYQDRPVVLYSISSITTGSKSNEELSNLAYEIIRVPDRNAPPFETKITEPSIQRVGRNVAFAALNEGALIIESVKEISELKKIANKYFPAFFLAINQRELLLKTMQSIAQMDTRDLNGNNDAIFPKMEYLRNRLLLLQLKQIFYSVSNFHEVELFFNQLQRAFAVEKMLMENEQCIREMYNLLEVRRKNELERFEKEKNEREEHRSSIINTILGAIGCLGLFSFLKDFLPFINDSATYMGWYKIISIFLPIFIMLFIIRLVFFSKK
jgi:hypothetical protein